MADRYHARNITRSDDVQAFVTRGRFKYSSPPRTMQALPLAHVQARETGLSRVAGSRSRVCLLVICHSLLIDHFIKSGHSFLLYTVLNTDKT